MSPPSASQLTSLLKQKARSLGFQLCGVCKASEPHRLAEFKDWLAAGHAGTMHYLQERESAYEHPEHVLEGAESILMLGMNYSDSGPHGMTAGHGRVARYAWGKVDYHDLIHDRLKQLCRWLREQVPAASARGVVDTAPLLERDFAQQAGLGWVGKNTMLISRKEGSQFFLAALLTDQPLESDDPFEADHCGSCRACLDACPTSAFPEAYVLDATRCISYLTIEHRGTIPAELRAGIGNWTFGCDVCQDVCPWNTDAGRTAPRHPPEAVFDSNEDLDPLELTALFFLSDQQFRERFRKTPLWRSRRCGLLRNAAIVLGNQRHQPAVTALERGLSDNEPVVRSAAAWALGQLAHSPVGKLLNKQLSVEKDPLVIDEIQSALKAISVQDAPGVTSP